MPCAICENWIPRESQVYRAEKNADGDGGTVYILRGIDGTEKFRVATLDVATISETLAVRAYKIEIMEKFGLVHIRAEILRWRLCEASPPPRYIKKVSFVNHGLYMDQWYFICEKCRDKDSRLEDYTNINFEGAPSTASEDEDDRDSVYNFRN